MGYGLLPLCNWRLAYAFAKHIYLGHMPKNPNPEFNKKWKYKRTKGRVAWVLNCTPQRRIYWQVKTTLTLILQYRTDAEIKRPWAYLHNEIEGQTTTRQAGNIQ